MHRLRQHNKARYAQGGQKDRPSLPLRRGGFVLVLVLLLMALVLLVSGVLFSLSTSDTQSTAMERNKLRSAQLARAALLQGVGALQEELGDDRRVSATADLLHPGAPNRGWVGAFDAQAGPGTVTSGGFDYAASKEAAFRRWLVSSPAARKRDLPLGEIGSESLVLFDHPDAAFRVRAPVVAPDNDSAYAWVVVDEGVKARINVGEDAGARPTWQKVSAPAGPNLGLAGLLNQPGAGWTRRRTAMTFLEEVQFEDAFGFNGTTPDTLRPHFTTHSRGLQTDTSRGGLKVDLSLAFEMADDEYDATSWGAFANPFRGGTAPRGEVPLYPLPSGHNGLPPEINVFYDTRADECRIFPTGLPPTFDHLRDFYRLSRTIGESRNPVDIRPLTGSWWDASQPSGVGVAPVLNRVLFFFSPWVDPADRSVMQLVLTPLVVLWNPYDVPIASPAYFVYQRLDIPVGFEIDVYRGGRRVCRYGRSYIAGHLGRGLPTSPGSGRSLDPYFLIQITRQGTDNTRNPIVIGPGEVRLFGPVASTPIPYQRTGTERDRTIRLRPINSPADLNFTGGFAVPLNNGLGTNAANRWNFPLQPADEIDMRRANFARDRFHYLVTLENGGRLVSGLESEILSEVMVYRNTGGDAAEQFVFGPRFTVAQLATPRPFAVLETFNRTAAQPGSLSNILFTVNARQRFANPMLSGANFSAGPHYQTDFREVADFLGSGIQVTPDGQRTFFGPTNESVQGRDRLPLFELPARAPMSLACFGHADLVDTSFAPANALGNSWASPYLPSGQTARILDRASTPHAEPISNSLVLYDHSYLLNRGLWDGFFLSSIAPGSDDGHGAVLRPWLENPGSNPLPNPRHTPWLGTRSVDEVAERLIGQGRALYAGAHVFNEGAFNVNSTDEVAWTALLASLREVPLDVRAVNGGNSSTRTPEDASTFHRMSHPLGTPNDAWTGFRELSDDDIRNLAGRVVEEVRKRGPFLSLAEFVNRRVGGGELGWKGALQSAIDNAGLNDAYRIETFDRLPYPARNNIRDPYTGVGIPGWLTQADILRTIGNSLTVRSDTFVIRAMGEYRGVRTVLEATVQRLPEFVDPSQDEATPYADLNGVNAALGRRFVITSVREIF